MFGLQYGERILYGDKTWLMMGAYVTQESAMAEAYAEVGAGALCCGEAA